MKPLELTVYPPLDALEQKSVRLAKSTGLAIFHTPPAGFFEMKAKRLTNAELAAEYWRAQSDESVITEGYSWAEMCGGWNSEEYETCQRAKTLLRFAALPHYDQEVTP